VSANLYTYLNYFITYSLSQRGNVRKETKNQRIEKSDISKKRDVRLALRGSTDNKRGSSWSNDLTSPDSWSWIWKDDQPLGVWKKPRAINVQQWRIFVTSLTTEQEIFRVRSLDLIIKSYLSDCINFEWSSVYALIMMMYIFCLD